MSTWKQASVQITTPWASDVDSNCPLPEYPRPQMTRNRWTNLNGLWDYRITDKDAAVPTQFSGEILVPYAIESALSGVKKSLSPNRQIWYRRTFKTEENSKNKRTLLHFEAVDWYCRCYINGHFAGDHQGGYLPFFFDITDYLNGENDEENNELVVSVWDPTDSHWQQKGKQVEIPNTIYYTATSGIWQTVWLETVDKKNHIIDLKITPSVDKEKVLVSVTSRADGRVNIYVKKNDITLSEAQGAARTNNQHNSSVSLEVAVSKPQLWSPKTPFLYDLVIELYEGDTVIDSINSYFGMRSITTAQGDSGHTRMLLNDEPIFLHGPLDQGYWPESGMTPATDEALIFDLKQTKALGFNMTRKHIKIESRRWYYHADRLGLIVIQDMVNGGKNSASLPETLSTMANGKKKSDTTKRFYQRAWRESAESRLDFENESSAMIDHLFNATSILIWVPFNESWGQFDAARIAQEVKTRDPSRLVDHASGWFDQGAGDFCSRHTYVMKLKKPPRKDTRVYFISEYGGYNCQIDGHLWDSGSKFGYKMLKNTGALEEAYTALIRQQLIPLITKGLGAAVYTQFSDVEIESNGLFSYDRKVLKIPASTLNTLNNEIYDAFRNRELS
ncbi:MAG: beta-galactosidase/beta-glucuronidase [Gammaproteobacteria bacterium]|jgi:beta-galactosidase/beta-glucuronidase